MSEPTRLISMRATFAGRWQVPALVLGLLFLAASLERIARDGHEMSFPEELALIGQLREVRASTRASAYILDQLKKPRRPALEKGELARQLAGVIYDVEAELAQHKPENTRAIIANYHLAQKHGVNLEATDWVALGDGYHWNKNRADASDAYRQALRLGVASSDRLRRRIVELEMENDAANADVAGLSPDSLAQIETLLASETASPPDYYWALEKQVEWLLEKSDERQALDLIEEGRKRLEGTEECVAVNYLEAQCLVQEGRGAEAEAVLRSLRDKWSARDDLWGKAGLLLGHIQQDSGRPKTALAFYEEILKSFPSGELHETSLLGHAETLATLARYEEALSEYKGLSALLTSPTAHRTLDRRAIQTNVGTIGQSLLTNGKTDLAAAYLELALQWTMEKERNERMHFLTLLAGAYGEMAATTADPARARDLHEKSGEIHITLSRMQASDDLLAAKSMELAVTDLEAAGMTARLIEVLDQYASTRPAGVWRSTALFTLAKACQSVHRYSEAITAYQDVINTYPRMPDALRSMVPLADCLLAVNSDDKKQNEEQRHKGVELLRSIVEDRGKAQLFAPSAAEYREALFRLADYYSRASDQELPDHCERAVARWEEWIALYPDDVRMTKAHFQLADAYRRSAAKVVEDEKSIPTDEARQNYSVEVNRRLEKAQDNFRRVITELAPRDASLLAPAETSYLRAGYLYLADVLFDLGRYSEALEAYREAAWRYEDEPVAVTASLQVVHCHELLGRPTEAAAALARTRWLLAKMPDTAFKAEHGVPSKQEMMGMIERIQKSGLY